MGYLNVSKSAGRIKQATYKRSFGLLPRKAVVHSLLCFSHNPGRVFRKYLQIYWSLWILPRHFLAHV